MRRLSCLLSLVIAIQGSSACFGQAPVPAGDEYPAGITYKDLMLVLVTEDGAAAVVFPANAEEADGSLNYSFRYESRDGKVKKSGKGQVAERHKPGTDPEVERNADGTIAGEPYIAAGPIRLQWSAGTADSGFVYYAPERVKVHIAHAKFFQASTSFDPFAGGIEEKALDLRRFMK